MMLNERFWNKVNKDAPNGCWEWTSCVNNKGYGMVSVRYLGFKHKKLAHRMAFMDANGPIEDGMYILHSCDNPRCVNPAHLRQGNDADNVQDMWSRGRASPPPRNDGFRHWLSKLTPESLESIRAMHASGQKVTHIARSLGLSRHVVSRAISGKTYRQL